MDKAGSALRSARLCWGALACRVVPCVRARRRRRLVLPSDWPGVARKESEKREPNPPSFSSHLLCSPRKAPAASLFLPRPGSPFALLQAERGNVIIQRDKALPRACLRACDRSRQVPLIKSFSHPPKRPLPSAPNKKTKPKKGTGGGGDQASDPCQCPGPALHAQSTLARRQRDQAHLLFLSLARSPFQC